MNNHCNTCGKLINTQPNSGGTGYCNCLWNNRIPVQLHSAPQGWQCPCCRKIYSPAMTECYGCNAGKISITVTGGAQGG